MFITNDGKRGITVVNNVPLFLENGSGCISDENGSVQLVHIYFCIFNYFGSSSWRMEHRRLLETWTHTCETISRWFDNQKGRQRVITTAIRRSYDLIMRLDVVHVSSVRFTNFSAFLYFYYSLICIWQDVLGTTLHDKVCRWPAGVSKWAGTRYFYPPEIVYSTGRNYWTPQN